MKKLFLGMLAIAAMIATSCVQDQDLDLGVNAGGETVAVSFNLDTPTRAYSDGLTATVLQYAIYDANGNELVDLTKTNGEIHGSTTVTLQLVTGNTYTAIFWAAAPNAPYTVDFANKKVTVDYTAPVCNDEDRDAFFCHTAPFTVDGAMTVEAKLYRPFAQINIGVSDYALATAAGFTPTHSAVKVSNAYNTLNLWDGSVDGETAVTFESAEIEKDEVFPVTGYEYLAMNYILVNEQETIDVEFSYTDENATGAVESTKTCTVGSVPVQRNYRTNIYGAILTSNVDIKVEIVPAYEEPAYDEPLDINFVTTLEQLQAAINAASSTTSLNVVSFAADISGNVLINQKANVNLQINGCGHKFDGVFTIDGKGRSNGAETLTFSNINFETEGSDFTFIVSPKKLSDVWSYSHNVIVDGCTFKGNNTVGCVSLTQTYHPVVKNCTATGVHSLAQFQSCDNDILVENVTINAKNGISVGNTARPTIKNATIVATGYGVRGDGDQNRGALVIENSNITAAQPVIIRKVTTPYSVTLGEGVELYRTAGIHDVIFTKGQDDAAYVVPTGAYTYSSVANFNVFPIIENGEEVAEGLFWVADTKTYLVASAEGLIAVSATGVIKAGNTVALVADIDLAGKEFNGLATFHPEVGTTFDGKGHTVSNWTNLNGASDFGFIKAWVGPIKNLTIKNATLKTSGRSAIIAANTYSDIENCHVVDCTLEDSYWACGLIAGLHCSGSIYNCSVTGSSVKSNGGTGGIVGVFNEDGGTRGIYNCSVKNTTVNNTGVYGATYSAALFCGMFNISNATVKFVGNTYEGNTKVGEYVGDLYYSADDDITIVVE